MRFGSAEHAWGAMSGFDLMFAMFGLLLGLAVSEVLGGMARTIKMRRKAHVGWLTPLLGLVVLLHLNNFWWTAYALRTVIDINAATLLIVLALVGGYYLVSTLIFPDDPEQWPDFDLYYDRHNRIIVGAMIAIELALVMVSVYIAFDDRLAAAVLRAAHNNSDTGSAVDSVASIFSALHLPMMMALFIVRRRDVNIVLLSGLVAVQLVSALAAVL